LCFRFNNCVRFIVHCAVYSFASLSVEVIRLFFIGELQSGALPC